MRACKDRTDSASRWLLEAVFMQVMQAHSLRQEKLQCVKRNLSTPTCGRRPVFQFFLKVYLARLVLGKVTKTAFPCCLAVAFFVCMPDSQCVQDFLGVGENLISIGLDLFLENIVWESPTTLSVYVGNHLRLYHGVSGSAPTNSDVAFLLDLVEM